MSSGNYSVIAVPMGLFLPETMPSSCAVMKTIEAPVGTTCEIEGRVCGLKSDDGETVCHDSSRGIKKFTILFLLTSKLKSLMHRVFNYSFYNILSSFFFFFFFFFDSSG
ncbi:hypothetical protein Hanom_Chr13g01213421 [Helianthus anomalus]